MRSYALTLQVGALSLLLIAGCSGSDDDTGLTRDVGSAVDRDGGVDRDAGDSRDGGERDAGEVRDAGPPDTGIVDPMTEPFRTVRNQGAPEKRIDIVFIGDGYTREELGTTFTDHVDNAIGRTLSNRRRQNDATQPFRSYRLYFNAHQVHVASSESGIDNAMRMVDTALDAREGPCGGLGGGGCPLDFAKASAAIDAALVGSGIVPDVRVVLLNTDTDESGSFDTASGSFIVLGGEFGNTSFSTSEALMREMAVAWAGLAYETSNAPGGVFPGGAAPAVNTSTSASGSWPLWDGYDQNGLDTMAAENALNPTGAYEGAGGYEFGLYRSTQNSKLGDLNPAPFNAVSRERIVQRIFETIGPLDDFLDNSQRLTDPNVLYVDPVDDDHYEVTWTINGEVVPNFAQTSFGPIAYGVPPGVHTITASVSDSTSFVRGDRSGIDTAVSWQVLISP